MDRPDLKRDSYIGLWPINTIDDAIDSFLVAHGHEPKWVILSLDNFIKLTGVTPDADNVCPTTEVRGVKVTWELGIGNSLCYRGPIREKDDGEDTEYA